MANISIQKRKNDASSRNSGVNVGFFVSVGTGAGVGAGVGAVSTVLVGLGRGVGFGFEEVGFLSLCFLTLYNLRLLLAFCFSAAFSYEIPSLA